MKHTPKSIKKALDKVINELSLKPALYAKTPEKDFTRTRKLPFHEMAKIMLSMTGKTLSGELMECYGLKVSMPTVSAFTQQRNKLSTIAFEMIFHRFTQAIDEQNLYKGYRLIAIDGTTLQTPTNPNECRSYHKKSNGDKPYNSLHLNAMYDLNRKIYVDAIVQKSEHKAFNDMVDRDKTDVPTLYIADRGYEAYNNMAHVQEKGAKFLIRVKDVTSCNGISKGLKLPSDAEFDTNFLLKITRQHSKQTHDQDFKYIAHSSPFDYLPKTSKKSTCVTPFELSVRVVRFKISDNTYETIVTNLDSSNFSNIDLKELYAMRWGIETSFRSLKYTLGLTFFHSIKTEYIIHEIFAKITMYNFTQLISSHIVVKQKSNKYLYRINFSAAVHICRDFFLKNISAKFAEILISQHVLPVRESVSNSRKLQPQTAKSFVYRLA